jgi:hypothetical protein
MNGPFSWKSHWENLRIVSTNEKSASFEQRIGAKLISQNCNLKTKRKILHLDGNIRQKLFGDPS